MKGHSATSWWTGVETLAVEKGLLDLIDIDLIHTLVRKCNRPDDFAFFAVLGCLIQAIRSGGLRIPIASQPLGERIQEFLNTLSPDLDETPPSGQILAEAFTEARLTGSYDSVLGSPEHFFPLIHSGQGLYFQKYFAAEKKVGIQLKRLLQAPDVNATESEFEDALKNVLETLPLRLHTAPNSPAMEFDKSQKQALGLALRKRFTLISGGPGTGKTSLAANLIRAWTRLWLSKHAAPPRIRLTAPTGRAAQRLSESVRRSLESLSVPSHQDKLSHQGDPSHPADILVKQLSCGTLHSLLKYNPGTGDFFHQAHRPLPADLIVVDEASMVDIFVLAKLLDALETDTCLILLGDMDQLPSVDAGSVLADLAPSGSLETRAKHALRDHLILLNRSHRSQANIITVTTKINTMDASGALQAMPQTLHEPFGDWPIAFQEGPAKICPEGGCRMLQPSQKQNLAKLLTPEAYRAGWDAWLNSWLDFHYLDHTLDQKRFPGKILATPRRVAYTILIQELCALSSPKDPKHLSLLEEIFAYLDQARILTLTRKGWYGAENINRKIRERLLPQWDPLSNPNKIAVGNSSRNSLGNSGSVSDFNSTYVGCPILILENDPSKGLFNGDIGVRCRIQGRNLAWFRRGKGFQEFPTAFLPRHESAFAMTVHKSQGSEFDQALLVLPESGNRLLYKETVYTAITRARFFAGIYGSESVFKEAVSRKVFRESGLPETLSGWALP